MPGYSLDPRLRDIYVVRLNDELRTLSGAAHERFGYSISDRLVPVSLQHTGLNLEGAPVGYTVDSASADGMYAVE